MRISIVALSCSLAVGLATRAAPIDYAGLDKRLSAGADARSVATEIASDRNADRILADDARRLIAAPARERKAATDRLAQAVRLRSALQDSSQMGDRDRMRRWAEEAKKSPLYTDHGAKESSNWVGKGLENLGRFKPPTLNMPDTGPRLSFAPVALIYVVWALLGLALLFLAYLALRHFSWKRNLQRKAKGMLAADEPERTLDEWLALAEKLTAEGKYREAVRCLYLACLLRFDEHLVARFDRGQTNWEHLARIRSSSKLPLGLDFEPPTRRFDTVWYGERTRGMPDVEQFRDWYQRVTKTLAEVPR